MEARTGLVGGRIGGPTGRRVLGGYSGEVGVTELADDGGVGRQESLLAQLLFRSGIDPLREGDRARARV